MGKFIEYREKLQVLSPRRIREENLKKSKLEQGRRVRFGGAKVHLVSCDDHKEDIWYTRSELGDIAADNSRMIKQEKKYLELNPEDRRGRKRREDELGWSSRGLEHTLDRYGKFRMRKTHARSVLRFQYEQRPCNAQALADHARYSSSGNGSSLRARSNAIQDQLEAAKIRKDVASSMRKSQTLPRDFKQSVY